MTRLPKLLALGLCLSAPLDVGIARPLDWGAVVVPVPVAVGGPPPVGAWVVAPYTDVRTGRCLAGFARDALSGACTRHDEPALACLPGGDPCIVVPPSPQPYGPGPALRLNY